MLLVILLTPAVDQNVIEIHNHKVTYEWFKHLIH